MPPASSRPRLVHRAPVTAAISLATASYLRLVARTTRWRETFDPEARAIAARGEGAVYAFWHQRLLLMPRVWTSICAAAATPPREFAAIVSRHGDGELIARTLGRLGIPQIRGSTRRGGAQALRQATALVRRGGVLGVVVDGPRGPHGHVHPGALFVASKLRIPVVPVTYAVAWGVQAGSWDRLLVPVPGGRGVLAVGTPIAAPDVGDTAALAAARDELATALASLNTAADAALGVSRAGVAMPVRTA